MARLTQAEWDQLPKEIRDRCVVSEAKSLLPSGVTVKAKGKPKHVWGEMNTAEKRFATELNKRKGDGAILWWKFEAVRFSLAKKTTYTPDFMVMLSDCSIVLYEVKSLDNRGGDKPYWFHGARVKIKVAAAMYPFTFIGVVWSKKTGWVERAF